MKYIRLILGVKDVTFFFMFFIESLNNQVMQNLIDWNKDQE